MKRVYHTKTTVEYTFNEEEVKLIEFCLNYCYHRATKHRSPVTSYQDKINKLRKQLNK